jgi:predicted RNase H-like HicB family nuclease
LSRYPTRNGVVLELGHEVGGINVVAPALPGYVTEGDTVEQCLIRAQNAIEGLVFVARKHSETLPEPRLLVFPD